jgi:hypothetical protein
MTGYRTGSLRTGQVFRLVNDQYSMKSAGGNAGAPGVAERFIRRGMRFEGLLCKRAACPLERSRPTDRKSWPKGRGAPLYGPRTKGELRARRQQSAEHSEKNAIGPPKTGAGHGFGNFLPQRVTESESQVRFCRKPSPELRGITS